MATDAVVNLQCNTNRFTQPLTQAGSKMRDFGATAQTSLQKMSDGSERAVGAATKLKIPIIEVKQHLTAMGTAGQTATTGITTGMQRASMSTQQLTAATNASRTAMIGQVTSMATVGISVIALEASLSKYNKSLLNIERKEDALEMAKVASARANTNLEKSQNRLNKMQEKGLAGTRDYEIQLQAHSDKLAQATVYTNQLETKTKDLEIAHMDFADTLKLLGSSIFITFLTVGSSVGLMLTNMAANANMTTGAFVKQKLAVMSNSRAMQLLGPNIKKMRAEFTLMRVSMVQTGPAFVGMRAQLALTRVSLTTIKFAVRGLYAALGPLGWAMLGLGVAAEVVMNDVGGVRTKLDDMTGGAVSSTLGLEDLNATAETTQEEMDALAESAGGLADPLNELGDNFGGLAGSMTGANTGLGTAVTEMDKLLQTTLQSVAVFQQNAHSDVAGSLDVAFDALLSNIQYVANDATLSAEQMNIAYNAIIPTLVTLAEKNDIAFGDGASKQRIEAWRKEGKISHQTYEQMIADIDKVIAKETELVDLKKNEYDDDKHMKLVMASLEQNVIIKAEQKIRTIGGDMIHAIRMAQAENERIQNKHYAQGGRQDKYTTLPNAGMFRGGRFVSDGRGGWQRTHAAGHTNNQGRKQEQARRRSSAIALAKSWGWSFRRRGSRGSVQTYFRDMAGSAEGYVREVRRRAAGLGVEPGPGVMELFNAEADRYTDLTERSGSYVRTKLYGAKQHALDDVGSYVTQQNSEADMIGRQQATRNKEIESAIII